jgi:hypothetical protein
MTSFFIRPVLHYGLHFLFPLLIAFVFYKDYKWKAYFILIGTMIIDLDHLLANPVFDPTRCSIGFHPLHTGYALTVYTCLLFFRQSRIVAIGLLLHLITDFIDCLFIS